MIGKDYQLNIEVELLDHKNAALWAIDCAQRVLVLWDLNDDRPKSAIEAGKAWVRDELKMTHARTFALAAHAAARQAEDPAAIAAARSAGHACATAHVKGHATYAASYAIAAVTASAGIDAGNIEREWQMERLRAYQSKNQ